MINTCSGAVSFARELENKSAAFYKNWAESTEGDKEVLLSLAKENAKFVTQVERAYYGVITDAFEGCFAFDMDAEEYTIETDLPDNATHGEALSKALKMEETIVRFYTVAAEQSKSLMADVPRAFTLIVKKRANRPSTLQSLQK
jgi:rubrerythrin